MSLLLLVILSAAAPAPASETCGPTKFTLNKPVQTEPPAKQKAEPGPKASATMAKSEAAKAKPKTKPLADCDKPKKG
jgi:hypothetical protein